MGYVCNWVGGGTFSICCNVIVTLMCNYNLTYIINMSFSLELRVFWDTLYFGLVDVHLLPDLLVTYHS
jgi:hypothetical protein